MMAPNVMKSLLLMPCGQALLSSLNTKREEHRASHSPKELPPLLSDERGVQHSAQSPMPSLEMELDLELDAIHLDPTIQTTQECTVHGEITVTPKPTLSLPLANHPGLLVTNPVSTRRKTIALGKQQPIPFAPTPPSSPTASPKPQAAFSWTPYAPWIPPLEAMPTSKTAGATHLDSVDSVVPLGSSRLAKKTRFRPSSWSLAPPSWSPSRSKASSGPSQVPNPLKLKQKRETRLVVNPRDKARSQPCSFDSLRSLSLDRSHRRSYDAIDFDSPGSLESIHDEDMHWNALLQVQVTATDSLQQVLRYPIPSTLVLGHFIKIYAPEVLFFYMDASLFHLHPEWMYELYLAPNAPLELNLTELVRLRAVQAWEQEQPEECFQSTFLLPCLCSVLFRLRMPRFHPTLI
jgi:hypothetical protein